MKKNSTLIFFSKPSVLKLTIVLFILFFAGIAASFAQSTYTWNNTGTGDWTIAANWTPTRSTPASNDILQFNNGATTTVINIPNETIGQLLISNSTIVNFQTTVSGNTLTISGLAGGDDMIVNTGSSLNSNGTNVLNIVVSTGATGNISGNMSFSNAAHKLDATDVNSVIFNSPAIFTQDVGCTGNVFTNSGASKVIVFNTGTTFLQKAGSNPFALAQPSSKVVFNTGNLFKVVSNLSPSFSGRTYANVEIDNAAFSLPLTGTAACSIDNLTVTQGNVNLNLTTGGVSIKGNISVAAGAILNFNPTSTGTLSFNGTTPQSISNAGTLTFGNNETVVFNNGAGITINNNILLNNAVTFTAGVVKMVAPAVLALSATASTTGASNASFVDGFVKKIGNTAFVFPVGRATASFTGYIPIQISAPALATDEYVAAYNRSSAVAVSNNYVTGLDHVSGVDYWTLSRTSGSSPIDVTLNWTNESSSGGSSLFINDKSKLVVAHYDGATKWDGYGGVGAATGGFNAGTITWSAVNLFTPSPNLFSLGSIDAAANSLPVNLNYLNGHTQNNNNYLEWKINCDAATTNVIMDIERSVDGQHFININNISASALRCLQPFNYTDIHPLNGINYYRLKMIDGDGKTTYSSIITLQDQLADLDLVKLVPTIITNNAVLNVSLLQNKTVTIVITDVSGKQVQQQNFTGIAGNNQFVLNLVNLTKGVYQITAYSTTGKYKTVRFIKQ